VAKEVTELLGYRDTFDGTRYLDKDEVNTVKITGLINSPNPHVKLVSESGLYALIMRSRRPEAKEFRKWVTGEGGNLVARWTRLLHLHVNFSLVTLVVSVKQATRL